MKEYITVSLLNLFISSIQYMNLFFLQAILLLSNTVSSKNPEVRILRVCGSRLPKALFILEPSDIIAFGSDDSFQVLNQVRLGKGTPLSLG